MDNPNLLNCLILIRDTLPFFLHHSLHLSFLLPLPPLFLRSLFFPIYIFYSFPLPFFSLFFHSSLCFPFSLPLYLPLPLSSSLRLPFPSLSILPSLYFSSLLLFSLLHAFSLSIFRSMTLLIPLSSSPSLFFPPTFFPSLSLHLCLSPSPPSLCFFITHSNNIFNCIQLPIVLVISRE